MRVVWTVALLALPLVAGCFDPDRATMGALLEADEWVEGDVDVRGTVAETKARPSTAGDATLVDLKAWSRDDDGCRELLVPGADAAQPGDRIDTTLEFRRKTFNGVQAVWAEQMPCPGPGLMQSIEDVLHAVGRVVGGDFAPISKEGDVVLLEYRSTNAGTTPLSGLTLRLGAWVPPNGLDGPQQWLEAGAELFVQASDGSKHEGMGAERPLSEGFTELEHIALDGPAGQRLAFEDRGTPAEFDAGDRLRVTVPGDGVYLLQVDPCRQRCSLNFQLLVVADGAVLLDLDPWPALELRTTAVDAVTGLGSAEIVVVRTSGPPAPVERLWFDVVSGQERTRARYVGAPLTGPAGTVTLVDAGLTGVLDAGDRFLLSAVPGETIDFDVFDERDNSVFAALRWTQGQGASAPDLWWKVAWSGDVGTVEAHGPAEQRGLAWFHFALDDTPLTDGFRYDCPWSEGSAYTFEDRDGDRLLSTGDVMRYETLGEPCDSALVGLNDLSTPLEPPSSQASSG